MVPLFLTDTEVAALLFDPDRVYGYLLEVTLEAMALTAARLRHAAAEKQQLYHAVQRAHIHGSPDGHGSSSWPAAPLEQV